MYSVTVAVSTYAQHIWTHDILFLLCRLGRSSTVMWLMKFMFFDLWESFHLARHPRHNTSCPFHTLHSTYICSSVYFILVYSHILAYHQENTTMEGLHKHVRQLKGVSWNVSWNMFKMHTICMQAREMWSSYTRIVLIKVLGIKPSGARLQL